MGDTEHQGAQSSIFFGFDQVVLPLAQFEQHLVECGFERDELTIPELDGNERKLSGGYTDHMLFQNGKRPQRLAGKNESAGKNRDQQQTDAGKKISLGRFQ